MAKIIKIISTISLVAAMLTALGCGSGGDSGPHEYVLPSSATDTTQTISGFTAADSLVMPKGGSILISNTDPADGKVSVSVLSSLGGKVTAVLTDIKASEDANAFAFGGPDSKLDIKTVFPHISQATK